MDDALLSIVFALLLVVLTAFSRDLAFGIPGSGIQVNPLPSVLLAML